MTDQLTRKRYSSALTDARWAQLAPWTLTLAADSVRKPVSRREIVYGILHLLQTRDARAGRCHGWLKGKPVYFSVRKWHLDGTWKKVLTALRKPGRARARTECSPQRQPIDQDQPGVRQRIRLRWRTNYSLANGTCSLIYLNCCSPSRGIRRVYRRRTPLPVHDLASCFPRLHLLFAQSG